MNALATLALIALTYEVRRLATLSNLAHRYRLDRLWTRSRHGPAA